MARHSKSQSNLRGNEIPLGITIGIPLPEGTKVVGLSDSAHDAMHPDDKFKQPMRIPGIDYPFLGSELISLDLTSADVPGFIAYHEGGGATGDEAGL